MQSFVYQASTGAMTMTSSINFRVRPLYGGKDDKSSKETMVELDQAKRDTLFFGDSLERKKFKEDQELHKQMRKTQRRQKRLEKEEEARRTKKLEDMLKRGEGSEEKKIRSEVEGKENFVLNPYQKRYHNVDENITTIR